MMQTIKMFLKLFTAFLLVMFLGTSVNAVNIKLEGSITKVFPQDNVDTSCNTGDIYRLSNTTKYNNKEFDILLKIQNEDNDGDELHSSNSPDKYKCLSIKEFRITKPNAEPENKKVLHVLLRAKNETADTGNTKYYNRAFINFEIIPIKKDANLTKISEGTVLLADRLSLDKVSFTAFDLDTDEGKMGSPATGSDDIYIKHPGVVALADVNLSKVTTIEDIELDDKISYAKIKGYERDCDDRKYDSLCAGTGIINLGEHKLPSLEFRLQNDNALGTIHKPEEGSFDRSGYYSGARLFDISFESAFVPGLDHGDLNQSYGDAFHEINETLILGSIIADDEEETYSKNADADDLDADGDDEEAVKMTGADDDVLRMTAGYPHTSFDITTKGHGYLSAWVDSDKNGSFSDDEQIITDYEVNSTDATVKHIEAMIASNATVGSNFIRVRLSEHTGTKATDDGGIGEVEDHVLTIIASGSIHGFVFKDLNKNGIKDGNETGFADVNVTVTAANGETQSVQTGSEGNYTFPGVALGDATVTVDDTQIIANNYELNGTNPAHPTVEQGQDTTQNFGYARTVANLVTTKTVDKTAPEEGDTIVYTLTVKNEGPADTTNVTLTDKLPAGVTYVSHTAGEEYNKDSGVWNIPTLANGATATLNITATVDIGTASTPITNFTTPATSPDTNDTTPGGDDLNETIHVGAKASVSIGDVTVREGEDLIFTVTLSEEMNSDVNITISTEDGTANYQEDYGDANITVATIKAHTLTKQVSVPSIDDNKSEPTENFTLKAVVTSGNTENNEVIAQGTIEDNEGNGSLSIDNPIAHESDGKITFTVSISNVSSEDTVVELTLEDNTTKPIDHGAAPATVTIPANTKSVTVDIEVKDDEYAELNETMILKGEITSPLGQGVTAEGVGTIVDDELLTLQVNVSDEHMPEPKVGTADMNFTVLLTHKVDADTNIILRTESSTATKGEDFDEVKPITLTIKEGNTTGIVQVPIKSDNTLEGDEVFNLIATITSEIGKDKSGGGTGTIEEESLDPFTISSSSVKEGEANLTFEVKLKQVSTEDTVIELSIEDITTDPNDYTELNVTTVTIEAGDRNAFVRLPVPNDFIRESDPDVETLWVKGIVTEGIDAIVGKEAKGLGSISDGPVPNDFLSINNITVKESDGKATFTLTLNREKYNFHDDVNVSLALKDNTASLNEDYRELNTTLIVISGDTSSVQIPVDIISDDIAEIPEIFHLTAKVTSAAFKGNHAEGNCTITEDSNTTLSIDSPIAYEEDGKITFTVSISAPSSEDTVVALTLEDNTTTPEDHGDAPATVTIPANATSASVDITLSDDAVAELNETMILNGEITSTIGKGSKAIGIGTIIDDDEASLITRPDTANATVGNPVTIDVLANDEGNPALDPTTVKLIDPETNASVTELTIPGEGKWTVDPVTGELTFTPEDGFTGDPTPVSYTVKNILGNPSKPAVVTIDYAQGTISGVVYEDTNGNGKQDPSEPGIDGVKVTITDVLGNEKVLTTDENGQYAMEVGEGSTTITIDESTMTTGSTQTEGSNPTTLTVAENEIARDVDGYKPPENAGTINGLVYQDTNGNGSQDSDEPGLEGVKVAVTDADGHTQIVSTDSNGSYVVTVPAGEITVDVNDTTVPGGSTHTEGTDPVTITMAEDGNATVVNGYKPADNTGTVEGSIYEDANGNGVQDANESGLEGVTVTITDSEGHVQEVTTDENGNYTVLVPVGETVVTIDQSTLPGGSKQTEGENPSTLTVEKDATVHDKDGFKLPENKGSIEGIIYLDANKNGSQDSNESGIEGISVSVVDSKGSIQTLVTDSNGVYSTVVVAGNIVTDIADEDLSKNLVQKEGEDPSTVAVPLNGTGNDKDGFIATDAPVANDDTIDGAKIGDPVTIDVLANDTGDIDPTTVKLINPDTNASVTELTVKGEGKWTVDPVTGKLTFTPEDGFTGDPTPVKYTVEDKYGNVSDPAGVTIDYKQPVKAINDFVDANIGEAITVDVLANDESINPLDKTSVKIIDNKGNPVTELKVPNEGTWTVDPKTGSIKFTPVRGFTGNPTPIQYTVADSQGTVSQPAILSINYTGAPVVMDDNVTANINEIVKIDVLANDTDSDNDINASTVSLVSTVDGAETHTNDDGNVNEIVVPNEGTWTVDENGTVTFDPLDSFKNDPTPITYTVKDNNGAQSKEATIRIDVTQELRNDYKEAKPGTTVTLNILTNDDEAVDAKTVNLIAPENTVDKDTDNDGYIDTIIVDGEGTWTVDNNGNLTFTPEDKDMIQDPTPITYTAKDNSGHVLAPATVVIDYTNKVIEHNNTIENNNTVYVDRPFPVAVPAPQKPVTVLEGEIDAVDDNMTLIGEGPLVADVSLNDKHADGNFHLIDRTSKLPMKEGETLRLDYGSVTMKTNGVYTYTPYPETLLMDAYIEEDFQYILADDAGRSDIANVHICVTFECPETSDADALSNIGLSIMFFMLAMVGLYFVRKEESAI